MPRLIDADTVVTVRTYDDEHEEWGEETLTIADAMVKWADEGCPPTIDAEPVRHGRWIRMDDTFARWKCSECGAIESHSGWRYCHCGAKMDAKEA